MTPDVVYEVGNTRIKRGCAGVDGTMTTDIFDQQYLDWDLSVRNSDKSMRQRHVVAGSNPSLQKRLVQFLHYILVTVTEVTSHTQIPIKLAVENPETVGLDRLLGAVAANRRRTQGRAAVTVDVGTAATVNLVDADGVFRGGMILPGLTTMAKSLHADTAKLPQLDELKAFPEHVFPTYPTANAINAGIVYAIGGAVTLAMNHATKDCVAPQLFLTGGGAHLVVALLQKYEPELVPTLNLEGLLITAESLP